MIKEISKIRTGMSRAGLKTKWENTKMKSNDHKLVLTHWSGMEIVNSNCFLSVFAFANEDWTVLAKRTLMRTTLATYLLTLLLLFWFFFLTSSSALLISSKVTPCVERLVSRTRLACALRCVSLSSSRAGGTNDLQKCIQRMRKMRREKQVLFANGYRRLSWTYIDWDRNTQMFEHMVSWRTEKVL